MKAGGTEDTNTITETTNIVPVTTKIDGLSKDFARTFPPYSNKHFEIEGKIILIDLLNSTK